MAFTEDRAFELVKSAHEQGRLAHAFLITGASVAGGERLAARMIELVNPPAAPAAEGFDLFGNAPEPESASAAKSLDELEGSVVRIIRPMMKSRQISKDSMQELERFLHQSVDAGKWKVGVVLEADRLNTASENAFLKTLEEPPPRCLLILVTDQPERLLPTILSRCVQMPLMSAEQRPVYEGEMELLDALSRLAKDGFGSIRRALTIKMAFSNVMAQRKAALTKLSEAAFKEDEQHFKNTTDSKTWLKEREKFFIAASESEYRKELSQLLDVLIAWLGDVVRIKCGVDTLDYPKQKNVLQRIAESEAIDSLLLRMEALESLRSTLETNASEALALEVYFIKAFG